MIEFNVSLLITIVLTFTWPAHNGIARVKSFGRNRAEPGKVQEVKNGVALGGQGAKWWWC